MMCTPLVDSTNCWGRMSSDRNLGSTIRSEARRTFLLTKTRFACGETPEVEGYVSAFVDELDQRGRRLLTATATPRPHTAAGGIDTEVAQPCHC